MTTLQKAEAIVESVCDDLVDDLAEYRCATPCSPELYEATRRQTELLGAIMGMLKVAQVQQAVIVDLAIAENRKAATERNYRYNGIISWKNL